MQFPLKKIIINKYFIATVVFIAFMVFADKNNIVEQYKLQQQYTKIKREHKYYQQQIIEARKQQDELFSNEKNLEKYAREKYLMKKDNEDVFVIVKKDDKVRDAESEEKTEE
jgi:cell division protein FtsB